VSARPFDAVVLISFGGPREPREIRPFLANVLRGRSIPAERLEHVVGHYELFDGVSPITEITLRQAEGLRRRLTSSNLPVYVGMRNWHPFLEDTLKEMSADGVRRALGVMLAAHHSYSSCGQYKQNVVQARQTIGAKGGQDVEITYAAGWHTHEGFVDTNARHIRNALDRLPADLRQRARLVFTAHSIPLTMASESRYETELRESAALIAHRLQWKDWTLVYQSRSGRPQDPWLEPDVCDYLRAEGATGLDAVVLSPIGFVADHMEILYDLDTEAAEVCEKVGVAMSRAEAVNDDPSFLDTLADVVGAECQRYATGTPLQIVPCTPPTRTELPPPER